MSYEWPGYFIVVLFGFMLAAGPFSYFFPRRLRNIIILALLVRALGTLLRHWVIYEFYDGGDAVRYFQVGVQYAESIWNFDFSFLKPSEWFYARWWGTQGVLIISGFVVSLIGPTVRGEFLLFSTLALSGLLLVCKSFQLNFPYSDTKKYALWVLLWPSLWFWSSSAGKDTLILFASGLVIYGFTTGSAEKREKVHWIAMVIGLGLAASIRPHVAGVLVVSMAIAHWIVPKPSWSFGHVSKGIGIMILMAVIVRYGFTNLGIGDIDVDSVKEYVEYVSGQSAQGSSAIVAPGMNLWGIPLAFANVLFRPFIWEVSNPLVAAAALEMILFWLMVFIRRERIWQLLAHWRSNRLLRFAVPLTILYVLMLGMAVSNLGIIARQRIHIMPLMLIWLEALPQRVTVEQRPRKVWFRRLGQVAPIAITKPSRLGNAQH